VFTVGRISSGAPPEADLADHWPAKAFIICPILHLNCAYIERPKGRASARRRPVAGKRYIVREVYSLLPRNFQGGGTGLPRETSIFKQSSSIVAVSSSTVATLGSANPLLQGPSVKAVGPK
jgi:hypothetical protein